MPEIQRYSREGKGVGTVAVPKGLSEAVQTQVLWQAVCGYLANQREGNADTKRRGEVRGGGRKPWKQKHTGRARAGTIRSPIWRKGGIVFGPHPREYRVPPPASLRRSALVNSLRAKVKESSLFVIEALEGLGPKTKALAGLLKQMEAKKGVLLVVDKASPDLIRASRNLSHVTLRPASDLNCAEVLASRKMVVTEEAFKQLERLSQ